MSIREQIAKTAAAELGMLDPEKYLGVIHEDDLEKVRSDWSVPFFLWVLHEVLKPEIEEEEKWQQLVFAGLTRTDKPELGDLCIGSRYWVIVELSKTHVRMVAGNGADSMVTEKILELKALAKVCEIRSVQKLIDNYTLVIEKPAS